MPSRNVVKTYVANGFYHLYNRGVEKRPIFLDRDDYLTFLGCLKLYLTAPKPVDRRFTHTLQGDTLSNPKTIYSPSRQPCNYHQKITLLAYCLMPNHFHLLLQQTDRRTMSDFMRSLATRYSMHFNQKYQRVGKLFQGAYKAVLIETEPQFLWVSKYIHRNPLALPDYQDPHLLAQYPYSSYPNYLHLLHQTWLNTDDLLTYFSRTNPRLNYQSFVEEPLEQNDLHSHLTLEN